MAFPWITMTHAGDRSTLHIRPEAFHSLAVDKNALPGLVTMIGNRDKSHLLHALLGDTIAYPLVPHGQVHVWADPSTASSQHPIIVMDCELYNRHWSHTNPAKSWLTAEDAKPMSKTTYIDHESACVAFSAHVLYPLSEVIYYFADDLGGLNTVAHWIAKQITKYTKLETLRPRIVIVVNEPPGDNGGRDFARLLDDSVATLLGESVEDCICDIKQIFLTTEILFLGHASRTARAETLRTHMATSSMQQWHTRQAADLSFNFGHTEAFLSALIDKLCDGPDRSFFFVSASRPADYKGAEFYHHLCEVLRAYPSESWLLNVLAPMTSASILLCNYPPGSHIFASDRVFRELYHESCVKALEDCSIQQITQDRFCAAIEDKLAKLVLRVRSNPQDGRRIYLEEIQKLQPDSSSLRSNKTCLCLHRTLERPLRCGHGVCDICLQRFGFRSSEDAYVLHLRDCPLCGQLDQGCSAKLIPPTAGIRLLSIDGGGIRIAIALTFLVYLESTLRMFECPLSDYFDLIIGTSAGGIISLGMVPLRWSAKECLQQFSALSLDVFKPRVSGTSLLSQMQNLYLSYVADGQYSQDAIGKSFGKCGDTKLFTASHADTKVAVTSTLAKGARACLFTNYNGPQRNDDADPKGYDIIRADDREADISIGDAAKCTSAAPWYFKPHSIPGLGTFQDGGLQYNMPMNVAYWEKTVLWADKENIDFGIALGTGCRMFTSFKTGKHPPVKEGCVMRTLHAFLECIDGEREWWRFWNSLQADVRTRMHRLNIQLSGTEPAIDDTSAIPGLQAETQKYIDTSPAALSEALDSIYASMFYFELDCVPEYVDGFYQCVGRILCRSSPRSHKGRSALYQWLISGDAYFLINGRPVPCCQSAPHGLPPFRCSVTFTAESMDENVAISLRGVTSKPRIISGSPSTVAQLMAKLNIEAPFGRSDYRETRPVPRLPMKRNVSFDIGHCYPLKKPKADTDNAASATASLAPV